LNSNVGNYITNMYNNIFDEYLRKRLTELNMRYDETKYGLDYNYNIGFMKRFIVK
jgi:hypothetical protein